MWSCRGGAGEEDCAHSNSVQYCYSATCAWSFRMGMRWLLSQDSFEALGVTVAIAAQPRVAERGAPAEDVCCVDLAA